MMYLAVETQNPMHIGTLASVLNRCTCDPCNLCEVPHAHDLGSICCPAHPCHRWIITTCHLGLSPCPGTRNIIFVGSRRMLINKPSFAIVTGRGDNPIYTISSYRGEAMVLCKKRPCSVQMACNKLVNNKYV